MSASPAPLVRLAELGIDPAQLADYLDLLREEITLSLEREAGVLALNAVALKHDPTQIRLLEIYADEAAYQAHLRSPHFLAYKAATKDMVHELHLIEAEDICLGVR